MADTPADAAEETPKKAAKKAPAKKTTAKAKGGKLVIVESPAKAKTIGRILGREFTVMASMGHIRDLPDKTLGVDVKNNFEPKYTESKTRAKLLKELKQSAKKSSEIYLAPDPDREGEAIAWHLQEVLKKGSKAEFHRVTFHEITKAAVNKAFEKPYSVDMDRVNSQQARRVLDRLVGYQVSPLLWSQIERGISAGRVQSVALRIVVEREREVQAFEPKEYWNFLINLDAHAPESGKEFDAKLAKIDGKKFEISNETDANAILDAIRGTSYSVESVDVSPRKRNPQPPFITSSMQQAASSNLYMSASNAMRIAQQLYEGIDMGAGPQGLITYMRTDSVHIAAEAVQACREFVGSELGDEYVPAKPRVYKSKSGAQEAHEAIRPTDVTLTPEMARPFLDDQQFKLYGLIWRRFVASQMESAKQMRTTIEVVTNGADDHAYTFRTTVTITTFQGFLKVYNVGEEEEKTLNPVLAELKQGDECFLKDISSEQKFTEPPPRFSEASLIRELEANGIGRPSTYASIVGTIQNREYVHKESGKLIPSELGFRVNDFLVKMLPDLFLTSFTADMEAKLDDVEEGKVEWTAMLHDFYGNFAQWVETAKTVGAPEEEKAQSAITLIENVKEWAEPVKRGRRTYDDNKFFTSVKEKFEKDKIITEKQWLTLLRLAVTYESQLPTLNEVAEEYEFKDQLEEMRVEVAEMKKKAEASKASADDMNIYNGIFKTFVKVEADNLWAEPVKRGRFTYDDQKFFNSLKMQAESGKKLSEKQLGALAKQVEKYHEHIENHEAVLKVISDVTGVEMAAPAEKDPELEKMINYLMAVAEWAEPTKKGKRTFDDKSFFDSVASQFNAKGALSPRQAAALKKMHAKYVKRAEAAKNGGEEEAGE